MIVAYFAPLAANRSRSWGTRPRGGVWSQTNNLIIHFSGADNYWTAHEYWIHL